MHGRIQRKLKLCVLSVQVRLRRPLADSLMVKKKKKMRLGDIEG